MKEVSTSTDHRRRVVVMLILGAIAAITLIALTIGAQVARGQAWLPGLVLPLVTGAATGGITYALRRSKNASADGPRDGRWTTGIALAGVVFVGATLLFLSTVA